MLNEPDTRHRAQQRENAEPEERTRPVPLIVAAVTLAMVAFGVTYILLSDSFGNSEMGDRRTVADLSGPAPGASGAVDGKQLYAANCVACHQATGKGVPGSFPALDGDKVVLGPKAEQIKVLLNGKAGTAMASFKHLSDTEIAAVITYTRQAWSSAGKGTDPVVQPADITASR